MLWKYTLSILVLLSIGIYILYYFNPIDYLWFPKCPLKLLTGLSCPGCGMQRFLHAVLNGNFLGAIKYNYYLLYAIPYLFLVCIGKILPNRELKRRYTNIIENKYAIVVYILTFFLWFLIRNIYNL